MISGLVAGSGCSHEVGTIFGAPIHLESVSVALLCKGGISEPCMISRYSCNAIGKCCLSRTGE